MGSYVICNVTSADFRGIRYNFFLPKNIINKLIVFLFDFLNRIFTGVGTVLVSTMKRRTEIITVI